MSELSSDSEFEARLQALYRLEIKRAAADLEVIPIRHGPRVVPSLAAVLAAGFSALAIAGALVVLFSLRPGVITSPSIGQGATGSTSASAVKASAAPGAIKSQDGGIPGTIDGRPVLTGTAIADAVASSTDDRSFLIGGWFPAGGYFQTYCTALQNPSCTPYTLHLSKGSEESVLVYPSGASADIASYMATQPVVMRVHTHDSRCQNYPNLEGCATVLVLEAIVWLGPES